MRFYPLLAAADATPTPTTPPSVYDGAGGGGILQVILLFLVLGGIIAGCYYFTRFMARGGLGAGRGLGRMRVVDRLVLARDRMVAVVELEGNFYMIGVAQGSITMLTQVQGDTYKGEEAAQPPRFFSMPRRQSPPHQPSETSYDAYAARARQESAPQPRAASSPNDEMNRMLDKVRSRADQFRQKSEGTLRDGQDE